MSWAKSKAVPKGNGPFPQDESGSGEPTMEDIYRPLKEGFDKMGKHLEKLTGTMNRTKQFLARLQLQVQQPRLAAEADVKPDVRTRERMEGTAADDEKNEDISSAWVDDPMRLTSFGDEEFDEPSVASNKGIGDALVNE